MDVTVLRGSEEIPLHIQRRMVEVATVEHQMLPDKTGYVEVTQFDTVTAEQFISAVSDLEKQGMERLVIDLRDNPGGVVTSCVEMAAYILPENQHNGTILSTATKTGQEERYYCQAGETRHEVRGTDTKDGEFPKTDDHELNVPIAVLINGQSASAAEVFCRCPAGLRCSNTGGNHILRKRNCTEPDSVNGRFSSQDHHRPLLYPGRT